MVNFKLITITEAAAQGITRLRLPHWVSELDFIEIAGPLLRLWSPMNQHVNGRDPVTMTIGSFDRDSREWLPHQGPTETSPEYLERKSEWDTLPRF